MNEPDVRKKPIVGEIVPLENVNAGPLIVNVVHAIIPKLFNVPPV